MEIYEPREDSYLLQKYVEKYVKPGMAVLDMGTGSGIQAETAARKAKKVVAVDINPDCRLIEKNIRFLQSDLFSNIPEQKFDLIVFNPPYLPIEKYKDNALFSAKRGSDTTIRFLDDARDYLKDDGTIFLISSSLANQNLIEEAIVRNLFDSEMLEKIHVFFEDVFVLKLTKNRISKKFSHISNLKIFSHGKRGIILTGKIKSKKVAIKIKRPGSEAPGNIKNEGRFLEILNRQGIGPKLIEHSPDHIMYRFVKGEFIDDYIKASTKTDTLRVLKDILEQMRAMDKLGINKFEMHHPHKHIIVDKEPVLLDFERCRYTENPKNVTQFCDFLIGEDTAKLLRDKDIKLDRDLIIELAIRYKEEKSEKNFKIISGLLK